MTINPTATKAIDPLEQCKAKNQALIAALRYMLNECGHLESDADYNFANERAVLAAAEGKPMTIQPERGAINTTDSRVWTDWYENPFRALRAATEQQEQPDAYQRMLGVMRESTEWQDFDARNFLDDVLQEIGGATNYVVQYGDGPNIGKFRATLDA